MVMKILKRTLFVVGAILVLMAVVGLFLPSHVRVERSTVIKAPAEQVFPHVNDLKQWAAWSPWYALEPDAEYQYTGPDAGQGATVQWQGEKVGNGTQIITASEAHERIDTSLDFGDQGKATSYWKFEPTDEGTRVTWGFETEVGSNPLSRWTGVMIEKLIGKDYEQGLAKLKEVVEKDQNQSDDPA